MCREAHVSFLILIFVSATTSKCPESRKPHPTNCNIFYNCVNLPEGGYVWTPSKCSEGLVFESHLRMCVLPSETWTCNSLSKPTVIRKKHETLIKSYLDYKSDPLNLSEIVDSSYFHDSTSDEEINQETTPNSTNEELLSNLLTENENKNFNKMKTRNSINDKSSKKDHFPRLENKTLVSSVTWLGRIIDNLLTHRNLKIYSDETLLVTNSGFKSRIKAGYSTKNSVNKEDALFNHFVMNYIVRNNFENGDESLNKETETRKDEKLETTTSKIEVESTNVLNQSINGPKDIEIIIAIKNNLGKKQYFTIEKYEFLKDQLKTDSVDIIPCSPGIRLPNNTDCTKYYICEAKTATVIEFFCPSFTGFNEKTRICDKQTFPLCKKIENEELSSNSDEVETGNTRLLKKNLCVTVGKIADSSSPSHYYLCYSNNEKTTNIESVRMACPNNLTFCAKKKVCATKQFCTKANSK